MLLCHDTITSFVTMSGDCAQTSKLLVSKVKQQYILVFLLPLQLPSGFKNLKEVRIDSCRECLTKVKIRVKIRVGNYSKIWRRDLKKSYMTHTYLSIIGQVILQYAAVICAVEKCN